MSNDEIEKQIGVKEGLKKDWYCQLELTFQTHDLGHETKITSSKKS
jgi:hypothetical protein